MRPDVYSRGHKVEAEVFYYVAELEQLIREWVGRIENTVAEVARDLGINDTTLGNRVRAD